MITTHVLDLARGLPAGGVAVVLEVLQPDGEWAAIGRGATDEHGRLRTLTDGWTMIAATYRLTFDIGGYQQDHGVAAPFFPHAQIAFAVADPREHYHVPLLVSPFGYSTYRGS
ncbi:MAG TPA: hydroxyisourate hydrolase [Vicinamibacterales bacterium]|nr:hydroxyisourate hydrolase [Vicinamibacterales bacterium]